LGSRDRDPWAPARLAIDPLSSLPCRIAALPAMALTSVVVPMLALLLVGAGALRMKVVMDSNHSARALPVGSMSWVIREQASQLFDPHYILGNALMDSTAFHMQQGRSKEEKCGFDTDCPMNYDLSMVNQTATRAHEEPEKERNAKQLQARHDKARAFCQSDSSAILENGGWCYNTATATKITNSTDQEFMLPEHHKVADPSFAAALGDTILKKPDGSGLYTLTDLGAGIGQFGHALRNRLPGLEYHGYDGGGNVEEFTHGYTHFIDLTLPLSFTPTDWVFSSEVGEHIPHEKEAMVISNIHAHNCRGIVLTWGILGQQGTAHTNNHSPEYIEKIFQGLGYTFNTEKTQILKAAATTSFWLKDSTMVFERISKPAFCA